MVVKIEPIECEAEIVMEDEENIYLHVPAKLKKVIPRDAEFIYLKILDR